MKDTGFIEYVRDLLSEYENITVRAMFGGHSFYRDGVIFAIIAGGDLYFKADKKLGKEYEEAGSEPFTYEGKKGPVSMCYWRVPVDVMEDADALDAWMIKTWDVAMRSSK